MSGFDTIRRNALRHEARQLEESRAVLDGWGADAKQSMRENAPWTDRTGQARFGAAAATGIYAVAGNPTGRGLTFVKLHPRRLTDGGRIALIQDAPYGKYLELSYGSRYSIIQPTVATMGPRLTAYLRQVWS